MGFVEEHKRWLNGHIRSRVGERKGRLERGHGHGEKMFLERVWWPIFGSLEHLHPEYEVLDWRGNVYFVDFVWFQGQYKFAFEVKGYGPHVQNTDRIRYRRELNRETFLQALGYRVVAIPYDDLEEQPQLIITLLKSLLSPYLANESQGQAYTRLEKEVLLLAARSAKSIRPSQIQRELMINHRTAVRSLTGLCEKGKLKPIVSIKSGRVMQYEYVRSIFDNWLV
ncbi:DNA-binding CsgD family transcriptional regulator [Paenibacillus castaneae]|uniref:hypothetical protein n=1 Tax=Paenibacillus castaneae TaxID=474957 RepID=UPI000C9BB5D1|nr:hypothetical protein [Paenibacillus castaneae]NIK78830.1 DNA-binding CsgD family transcriptional regulator [Paenibacillus castaneae]